MTPAENQMKRVAIYARVSTKDKEQDVENQLVQLREFCDRQRYEVAGEYIDRESGKEGRRERSAFARLFEDAAGRKFDLVLFWSLDRFSREGIRKTILYLQQLVLASLSRSEFGLKLPLCSQRSRGLVLPL